MANALEKIEQLETAVNAIAGRVGDTLRTLEQVYPIVDALVAVVGKDAVLAEAQKIAKAARDAHVARALEEQEKLVEDGKVAKTDAATETSLLFVEETVGGETSTRLLPVQALAEAQRPNVVGLKVGDDVKLEGIGEAKIVVSHIFTPVAEAA